MFSSVIFVQSFKSNCYRESMLGEISTCMRKKWNRNEADMNSLYKNAKEHSIRTESRVTLIFLWPFSDSVLNFYNIS